MSGTLVMAIGLNPLRILRVAAGLRPDVVLAVTTPETEHLVFELGQAARHLGLGCVIQPVPGDGYRFDADLRALRESLGGTSPRPGGEPGDLHVVIAGGTKPMAAAQAVAADAHPSARTWALDDHRGIVAGASGERVHLAEPDTNLTPELLARLHAGLDAQPRAALDPGLPAGADAIRPTQRVPGPGERIAWLRKRLRAQQHIDPHEESEVIGALAEDAVMALVREVLPADRDVHAGLTVPLRHPSIPTHPAMEASRTGWKPRTFEVDGLVVRGTRAWVIENKFARLGLQAARVAASELDLRRRHLAGDAATGVLVMLDDQVGQRFAKGVSPFELAGIRVLTRGALLEAADTVLGGGQASTTELAGVLGAADWR